MQMVCKKMEMIKFFSIIAIVVVVCSCNSNNNTEVKNRNQIEDSIQTMGDSAQAREDSSKTPYIKDNQYPNQTISECIPSNLDTINKMFSLQYIGNKKYFTLKLGIKDVFKIYDTAKFTCHDPEVSIPRLNSYYDSTLCLERGCGMSCVVYYIFMLNADKTITYKSYDNAFAIDLKISYCVIINQKNYSGIIIFNYKTGKGFSRKLKKRESFDLPETSMEILDLKMINGRKINILFKDSTRQKFLFSKKDFSQPISKFYNEKQIAIGPDLIH